jgi:hypothetical protein
MTPATAKTAPAQSYRYMGLLNVELEVRNYEEIPPHLNYSLEAGTATVPEWVVRNERGTVVPGPSGVGMLPLQAFISGMQTVSGASASLQPDRLIAVTGGHVNAGAFTIMPLDADDAPVGERITEISGARALLESRLDVLSRLPGGWLDGDGITPTPAAVETARHLIWVLLNHGVPRPRIAPTPEGGVEAEWSLDDREVSVTFEPDGSLYGNSVEVSTGEITEPELNPGDHQAVADFVFGA